MNVRRYRARDMRDAMRQVREEQGEDAVILSSRRVDGWLEVVAALDGGEAPAGTAEGDGRGAPRQDDAGSGARSARESARQGVRDEPAPRGEHPRAPEPAAASAGGGSGAGSRQRPAPQWPTDPEVSAMRQELRDLRSLLTRQYEENEQARWAARHPLAAECKARLMDLGFREPLARSLAGSILDDHTSEEAWERLRARLSGAIVTARASILDEGGVLALEGPTGVGKTTTIARIALRQIRRMGPDSVTLVTMDAQRIGATRQLQAFGQMAGTAVRVVETEAELREMARRSAGSGHLILVDTAGQSPRTAPREPLLTDMPADVRAETWLVIAATTQGMALRRVLEAFAPTEPSALVLTKLDEAEQLGEVLSVLLDQPLGVAFMSDGQRIAEDFHRVDTGHLTRLALQEEPEHGAADAWVDEAMQAWRRRQATEREARRPRSADEPAAGEEPAPLEMIQPVLKGHHVTQH
ncbi:flagellar biosynthesis protein FlhF [Thioalkalivibrio sp. ALE21]|uniref:flagellar biosynthesis protein FlhF n=1 Tax=Thioalkalivibrio sp. ALE21 TaxID=1158175 RepID=UPI000D871E37|nr:flagellar biosynthesis protein FlhF [Thioalkalivibrio sp. ALE21]PYG04068.1 flagellar biosynthesis protein FlhF [Thioalkalivibrio sp. ALE21]